MSAGTPPEPEPAEERSDAARTTFFARLRPAEAAAMLEWLAAELRRGEVAPEVDGERVRFPLEAPVRLRISAARHASGGHLRLRLNWETSEHGAIEIDPT